MKTKKLYIIGRRPENIPDNWIVFNAPRPMLGDKDWCGDFHHGIFYAAVDPDGYIPKKWMQKNCDLDGWVVEYVSEEAAIQMVKNYYLNTYPSMAKIIEELSDQDLRTSFHVNFNKKEEVEV